MTRWPLKPLEEVTQLSGGSTPSRGNPEFWGGDIPWVTPTDLPMPDEGISIVSKTRECITKAGLNGCAARIVPEGTVLFSSRATIGKVAVADVPLATNQGFVNLVPNKVLISKFLAYSLWYRRSAIAQLAGSTTFKEVARGSLRKFAIPVPPIAEQEQIVMLLDEADELRKLRAHADGRMAVLIPALFNEMFGDPFENSKGWEMRPVSSFVSELFGGRSVNPIGSDEAGGEYRVLKISAVTWRDFRPEESKPVAADYKPPMAHIVQAGDLLFSRANTTELVGATSYVFETPPNLLLPDKLWRFVWKEPRVVDPLFVWWLFQAASVRRELGKRATGTGGSMKNISKPKVMTLKVPVPPLNLQKEFARQAERIRSMQAEQVKSREKLDALFQSMLHRAFAGEL